ncbi:VOC family protein [Ilumatobacter fluminis]|uniref:VOC family protein n=1 Tax=Ilumatobacter fluminis TaxID=467091 RepID=UPI001414D20F|nr:VOC family protein [Ilumatobacter fluminis]
MAGFPIKQVAMVVRDLDQAVRAYWNRLGVGPWTSYVLEPPRLKDMTYHGEPVEFAIRHALAWSGETQLELVQPLYGPSIFSDHLDVCGEGQHHLGIFVDDHPAAMQSLTDSGFRYVQGARGFGAEGDGAFAYFETDEPVGTIIEVIEAPKVRIPPDFVYPAEPGGNP